MKQLICEMCGGKELIKQDGIFVCQSCGTKYSVEDAKKMMVTIDTSAKIENALKNARRAKECHDYEQAEKYYGIAQMEDAENWEAFFYNTYCKAMSQTPIQGAFDIANCIENVLKSIKKMNDDILQNEAIKLMSTDLFTFASLAYGTIINGYNSTKRFYTLDKRVEYVNETRGKTALLDGLLTVFVEKLILEFGENEFTTSIKAQCYETLLKLAKELYNSTTEPDCDESNFNKLLQKYTDELKKIKPKSEVLKDMENDSFLDSFHTSEKETSLSVWNILAIGIIVFGLLRILFGVFFE
ncbi:MAG: TFIIB-type zinc finger domain-containing protein [Fibromonadaceae bacterium]|jgi:hypothetical protein|nr:TFIIB-type zinc finger domain-containing protein [Fibromonadaceae bacterium]